MHVAGLFIYPVKSCRGYAVDFATLGPTGFANDRRWMFVEAESGAFVSQRRDPQLARISVRITGGYLMFFVDDRIRFSWPTENRTDHPPRQFTIHNKPVWGSDQGDTAARACTEMVGRPVRLVMVSDVHPRLSPGSDTAQVGFADAYPLLITTRRSLADLNHRLRVGGNEHIPMDRFRPNIVVDGAVEPYEEDLWGDFQVGTIRLEGRSRCTRCAIITTDQRTGARTSEPTRTLLTYRVFPGSKSPCFGLNADHQSFGTIRKGDSVRVLSRRTDS